MIKRMKKENYALKSKYYNVDLVLNDINGPFITKISRKHVKRNNPKNDNCQNFGSLTFCGDKWSGLNLMSKPAITPSKSASIQIVKPEKKSILFQGANNSPIKVEKKNEPKPAETKPSITIERSGNRKTSSEQYKKKSEHAGFTIEKNNKNRLPPIKIQFPSRYITLEQALNYREIIISRKIKLSTESIFHAHNQIVKFRLPSEPRRSDSSRGRNKGNKRSRGEQHHVTRQPSRDEIEQIQHFITQELNKLTLEKFMKITDNITAHKRFLDNTFIEMLAISLHDQSAKTPLYAQLYSLFAKSILQTLDENMELFNVFKNNLTTKCLDSFKEEIGITSDDNLDIALGHCSFLGNLVKKEIIQIEPVYQGLVQMAAHLCIANIQLIIKILVPCGKMIETTYTDSIEKLFIKLEKASQDRTLHGRVRYPLIDFLEARKNNWDMSGIEKEMHTLKSAKTATSNRSKDNKQGQVTKSKPTPVIKAGENKFSYLMSDDDDEEFDEEEEQVETFDGEAIVREFVIDHELSQSYDPVYIFELLLAIALRPRKDVNEAVKMFKLLKEEDKWNDQNSFEAIVNVVEECTSAQKRKDFPTALIHCAIIFAHIIYNSNKNITVDQYQEVFKFYELPIVNSFLNELKELELLEEISASSYWMSLSWRPCECSHYDIAQSLDQEAVILMFPLYDSILTLSLMIEDGVSLEEFSENIDEMEESVVTMNEFAIGAMETFIKCNNMSYSSVVLPRFADKQLMLLNWTEKYTLKLHYQDDQVVDLIKKIAKDGKYNLNEYKSQVTDDAKHNAIVALL